MQARMPAGLHLQCNSSGHGCMDSTTIAVWAQVILSFASAFWDKVEIIDRISGKGDGAWQEFLNLHFYTGGWWGSALVRAPAPCGGCCQSGGCAGTEALS